MMFKSEVLPAPFGPMIEMSSPPRTDRLTPATARTPPKCLETSETTSVSSAPRPDWLTASNLRLVAFPDPDCMAMPLAYGSHDEDAAAQMQSFPRSCGIC